MRTSSDLNVDPSTIEVYEDTGTGRDTQRDSYQSLMNQVRAGEVTRVIVLEVSRLSRSMRDLATTVETIVDKSATGLHILDMNLALEPGEDGPYQRAFLNIMGSISQLEADMIRERTRSGIEAAKQAGKYTGRPPFGFDVVDGYLTPNEDYDMAVEILERVEKGESKRSTARFAGVARSTVGRIVDRVVSPVRSQRGEHVARIAPGRLNPTSRTNSPFAIDALNRVRMVKNPMY